MSHLWPPRCQITDSLSRRTSMVQTAELCQLGAAPLPVSYVWASFHPSFTLWISQQQLLFITYEQPPTISQEQRQDFYLYSQTIRESTNLWAVEPRHRERGGRHLGVLEEGGKRDEPYKWPHHPSWRAARLQCCKGEPYKDLHSLR